MDSQKEIFRCDEISNRYINGHEAYTEAYVKLLETYNDKIKESFHKKNELKVKFLNMVKWIMIGLFILLFASFIMALIIFILIVVKDYESVALIGGTLATVISSFITMVVAIFKLPKIIAKYLFNKAEDDLMKEVIKHIQNYELSAVQLENRAELDAKRDKVNELEKASQIEYSVNNNGESPSDDNTSEHINQQT